MKEKYLNLTGELYEYVWRHACDPEDQVLADLRAETEQMGEISRMLISREQGVFMNLMASVIGSVHAIEVGTFTGYSSICVARALPPEGTLLCVDVSEEWTAIARRYWARASLESKVELRLGDARDELARLDSDRRFDFAFIDADKESYDAYYELILPRVRPNGLILFDNMLRHGDVLAPKDRDARALDALNRKLAADRRVQAVLLPFADGLQICRKL